MGHILEPVPPFQHQKVLLKVPTGSVQPDHTDAILPPKQREAGAFQKTGVRRGTS